MAKFSAKKRNSLSSQEVLDIIECRKCIDDAIDEADKDLWEDFLRTQGRKK
jgi:hypothetical protein